MTFLGLFFYRFHQIAQFSVVRALVLVVAAPDSEPPVQAIRTFHRGTEAPRRCVAESVVGCDGVFVAHTSHDGFIALSQMQQGFKIFSESWDRFRES